MIKYHSLFCAVKEFIVTSIIEFDHVCFRYPEAKTDSLHDITVGFEEGSFTAILGHNGSGKSTLAKMMNGILQPSEGRVLVSGLDTAEDEQIMEIRNTVGMVFQNPDNQIVSNVVEEDVAFGPENLGIPPDEIRTRVDSALKQVDMYDFRLHSPNLLSGGQKQRVAIAGVLAMQPKVIVLDEPTAMLDPRGRQEVISTVLQLCREKHMTVLLITHHMDECIHADRLIVMSDGRIALDGTPVEVFRDVEKMESEGLSVPETMRTLYDLGLSGHELPPDVLQDEGCAAFVAASLMGQE